MRWRQGREGGAGARGTGRWSKSEREGKARGTEGEGQRGRGAEGQRGRGGDGGERESEIKIEK